MSDELHKPGDWMKVLRRIRFDRARDGVRGATIKAVGSMLASYANYKDGTQIRPGTVRVAVDCEIDYRTAKRCIAVLRDLGLIVLVRRAERRGQADEYRLDLPEDLLDRDEIDVWDPDQYEAEIDRLREKHRGRYQSARPKDDSLRVTEGTAETGSANSVPDTSAGHAEHRRTESAGHAVPDLRGTPCPPTYQSTYQGFDPPAQSGDQSTEVAVPVDRSAAVGDTSTPVDPFGAMFVSDGPRENIHGHLADIIPITTGRGQCPHGRSSRRNKDGHLRCPECRTAEENPTPPTECSHGVNARYRCPACARGLAGELS